MDIDIKIKHYSGPARTQIAFYHDGSTALKLEMPDGQPLLTVSVNLEEWGAKTPPKDQIWIKTWSGNEGIAEALEKAGVVTLTGLTLDGPHDTVAVLAKLADELVP